MRVEDRFIIIIIFMLTDFFSFFFSYNNSAVNASNTEGCLDASIKF